MLTVFYEFQVHYILNELVMGGMVLETNMTEILSRIEDQNKLEKQEVYIIFSFILSFFPPFEPCIATNLVWCVCNLFT